MNVTRREFIGGVAAMAAMPSFAKGTEEIRAVFLPWGHNMWGEALPEGVTKIAKGRLCNDHVKFDEGMWRKLVDHVVLRKMNTVVIDVGEFPVYPSHPERLKGFLMAPWAGDYDEKAFMETNIAGIDQLAAALG